MKAGQLNIDPKDQKIKKLLRAYKVKRIALFGSYINGKLKKHSDIDFLVEFDKRADLFDQAGLKVDLEELLKRKVDVVTPAALSKYFRAKVLKEAVYLS